MNEQMMLQKNEAWIWKNVHAFSRLNAGYGSIRCDAEDLYQECVAYLLRRFRKSGLTANEFKVSDLDLRHVMCEYVQSLLPVKVPKTARSFSKTMNQYRSDSVSEMKSGDLVSTLDRCTEHSSLEDSDFNSDLDRFYEELSDSDREVLSLAMKGYSWSDISRITGINKVSLVRAKDRIGKNYNRFMRESHTPIRRRA